MEGIHNLSRGSIDKDDGKLDHFVQVGPRVLFTSTFEVQHTNYLRGGTLFRWWRRRRSWSLSLFASLPSSGLDSRQSGAFRRECYCRRGEEGETHVFPYGFTVLVARAFQLHECDDFVFLPTPSFHTCMVPEACLQLLQCLLLEPSSATNLRSWLCTS